MFETSQNILQKEGCEMSKACYYIIKALCKIG